MMLLKLHIEHRSLLSQRCGSMNSLVEFDMLWNLKIKRKNNNSLKRELDEKPSNFAT